jgi:hypothetical protein
MNGDRVVRVVFVLLLLGGAYVLTTAVGSIVARPLCSNEIRGDGSTNYCDHIDLGVTTVKTPRILFTLSGEEQ